MAAVNNYYPNYYTTTTSANWVIPNPTPTYTYSPPPPRPKTALDRLDAKVAATCDRARRALG